MGFCGRFGAALLLLAACCVHGAPARAGLPPAAAGRGAWRLALDERFDSGRRWATCIYWGCRNNGGELETYVPEGVVLHDGLHLVASRAGDAYVSGQVVSDPGAGGGFAFRYGYVEARLRVPAGQGLWPAFWMLPVSHRDGDGEIDILEMIDDRTSDYEFHYHAHGRTSGRSWHGPDLSRGFHTVGLDWRPGSLAWYVDGRRVWSYRGADVLSEPAYLILNLAVGGDWPGPPDVSTPLPSSLDVRYVRVWQRRAA